jgi:glycosyltransferase involved in cell wall biosynthesis
MSSEGKLPCTVAILTYNSANTLPRAIESVADFSEIIVCDGGSTDPTLDIAKNAGAQVITQDPAYKGADGRIIDFASIRNQTLTAATQPWFFFLDSDEYASPALIEQIRTVIAGKSSGAYFVVRRYLIDGIEIACASSYPNRSMRFFARNSVDRFIKRIHERIQLRQGVVPDLLPGPLFVPVNTNMVLAKQKRKRYIALSVRQEGDFSWRELWHITWHTSAVSVLYLFRALRCRFITRGVCLPWYIEFDTQRYNIELIVALWRAKLSMVK